MYAFVIKMPHKSFEEKEKENRKFRLFVDVDYLN